MALLVGARGERITPSPESMELAQRITNGYGLKALTAERNPGRIAELFGIPVRTAFEIVAAVELGRRLFAESDRRNPFIRTPEDSYHHLSDMASLKKEQLRGLYLNVQSRLIHEEVISIGTCRGRWCIPAKFCSGDGVCSPQPDSCSQPPIRRFGAVGA